MSAARKFLSLNNGDVWRTDGGATIEIISLDMTGTSGFPLTGEFIADCPTRTSINWEGLTSCGHRLTEKVERPAVSIPAFDPYLEAAIDDELTLAALLHWQNFARPSLITPSCSIYGTHNDYNGHTMRNGSVAMPQWRRSWHAAGALISRCKLTIAPTDGGVAVHAETGDVFRAIYSEHPSEDHAIWFAMCKAAIAYLGSQK